MDIMNQDRIKRKTIATSVAVILLTGIIVVSVIIGGISYYYERLNAIEVMKNQVEAIAEKLSFSLVEPLWAFDKSAVSKTIELELKERHINAIYILNENGQIESGKYKDKENAWKLTEYNNNIFQLDKGRMIRLMSYYKNRTKRELRKDSTLLGSVHVYCTDHFLNQDLNVSILKIILQTMALIITTMVLIFITLNRKIFRPLKEISNHSVVVSEGHLTPFEKYSDQNNELGYLVNSFNRLVDSFAKISQQSQEVAFKLKRTVTENKETITLFSEITNNEAASLEEISSTLIESASAIKNISNNSQEGSSKLKESSAKANQGFALIDKIIDSIEGISQHSKTIKNSLELIYGITEETDMLALNASIEAAKAGDAGRGFSVVATEIRKLAEKSQITAKEIEARIGENNSIVEEAREFIINSQKTFKEILETTVASSQIISEISSAINEESVAQGEIINSVDNINAAMQNIIEKFELIKKSSLIIDDAAYTLMNLVAMFKIGE